MSKPRSGQYAHKIPSLMDETPINFYAGLAEVIGVNEAIVLQQIWFYINVNRENESDRHYHEGKWWVYNSYEQWAKKFFRGLTPRGVQNVILHLEKLKILESTQGVSDKYDRRKWYTVNRDVLETVVDNHYAHSAENVSSHSAESAPSNVHNLHPLNVHKMHDEKTENTTERTTEKKETTLSASAESAVSPVNDWSIADEADDAAMFSPKGKKQISAQAEKGSKRLSKPTTTTPPSPTPSPAAPVAVDDVETFSAKLDEVKGEKAKRKPNRMAQIIDGMWGKGVSGALLPMLMGRAKKKPHVEYNIEGGMTEAEIVAFSRWYRKQNPGLNMPETPYKVEGAIESFRNAIDYEGWMAEGEKYLRVYFPKESTPPQLAQQESSTEEIIAFKQQIVEQLATSGLDGMFGDLFDDYKQENIS
jgi:hypothetical protein